MMLPPALLEALQALGATPETFAALPENIQQQMAQIYAPGQPTYPSFGIAFTLARNAVLAAAAQPAPDVTAQPIGTPQPTFYDPHQAQIEQPPVTSPLGGIYTQPTGATPLIAPFAPQPAPVQTETAYAHPPAPVTAPALQGIYNPGAEQNVVQPIVQQPMPQPPRNLAEAVQTGGVQAQQPTAMPTAWAGQTAGAPTPQTSFAGDAFMGLYSPTNNWRFINPQQLPVQSTLRAVRQQSPLVDLYSGLFSLGGQNPENAWATFADYLPKGSVPGLSSFR